MLMNVIVNDIMIIMTHNNIKNLFETDWKMLSVKLTSFLLRKHIFFSVLQQDGREIVSNNVVSVNYRSLLLSKYRSG